MASVLIGYFPKKFAVPIGFGAPHLTDICSVSTCIAEGPPDDWIDLWLHNGYGLFATRERAMRALQGADASEFHVFAYRMLPLEFKEGRSDPIQIALDQSPWEQCPVELEPLPASFRSLGFDAVEKPEGCDYFGCSPLSCNGGWKEFETNEHCLVDSMARSIELAELFSKGGWEPGPYRVVEVLAMLSDASAEP